LSYTSIENSKYQIPIKLQSAFGICFLEFGMSE